MLLKNMKSGCSLLLILVSSISCTLPVENRNGEGTAETYSEQDSSAATVTNTIAAPLSLVSREHYHVVIIKQMKFDPPELTVEKGDTVVWVNNDITIHDVTEQPSNEWTSSTIAVGSSWQMIVTKSADYYCSIHVVMKGKLLMPG